MTHAVLVCFVLFVAIAACNVTLSNNVLPKDTDGNSLLTGEASVLFWNKTYYFYFNNWGGCPGIDCCPSLSGCASCCFNPPTTTYPDGCVYTTNHSVVVYKTADLNTWDYLGVALPLDNRHSGIEFRPQVVFCPLTQTFVMWYEDRYTGQQGYAVAHSATPQGPFQTVAATVPVAGRGRIGDYDVFVDADGTAYHVRTGLTIERLAANYSAGTGQVVEIPDDSVEAPAMFRRGDVYFVMAGKGCCACMGGSNAIYYTADHPMGPYLRHGDVGSNTTHRFEAHSPYNYVTRAQLTKIIPIPVPGRDAMPNATQYVWLGNAWVTAAGPSGHAPGGPRNQDLLYWDVLAFDGDRTIRQMQRRESVVVDI